MKNVELRWLEQETGKRLLNEWGHYCPETIKILQYREKIKVSDYSSTTDTGNNLVIDSWSEWVDIPVVHLEQNT